MTKNWIIVNVVLLIIACLLGWQLKVSIDRFNAENDLAKIQPAKDVKQKLTLEGGIPPLQPPRRYSAAEFGTVPDKNIFSDTRAREEKEQVAVVPEVPQMNPAQKPTLVGISISGNQRIATIIDPTAQGGGRKTQSKRVGDSYQGYIITDITEDQMVLENGNRRETIPLYAGTKGGGKGGKTAILATRVVSFGGGAAGGSGSVGALAAGSAARPTPQVPSPAPTAAGAQSASQSGIRPITPSQVRPQASGAPTWNEGTDTQGRRVIRTPFGDIVRDK